MVSVQEREGKIRDVVIMEGDNRRPLDGVHFRQKNR